MTKTEKRATKGMFAALGAASVSILRTATPQELFQGLCDAAVRGSGFKAAYIAMRSAPDSLKYVACSGPERMPSAAEMSPVLLDDRTHGIACDAFLSGRPSVSADFMNDPRMVAWRTLGTSYGVRSAVAVPILQDGVSIGIIAFYHDEIGAIDDDILALMVKIAENVTGALGEFEREAHLRAADLVNEQLRRTYAALSAVNEALMHTSSLKELFPRICEAGVNSSKFKGIAVLMHTEKGNLRYVAGAGRDGTPSLASAPDICLDADKKHLWGLSGEAFLTGKPCFTNDYVNDQRIPEMFRMIGVHYGIRSAASVPILRGGKSVGAIAFYLDDENGVDDDMLALMQRIADNAAFALDNFEKARQHLRSVRTTERMTKMYAVLSATNEAILKASSSNEAFQAVCDAVAADGGPLGAAVFVANKDTGLLEFRAAAGCDIDRIKSLTLSTDPADKYGQGLHGSAFHDQKVAVSYDTVTDPRTAPWLDSSVVPGSGCAAFPLTVDRESVGVIMFFCKMVPTGDEQAVIDFMDRIAQNISIKLKILATENSRNLVEAQLTRLNKMFLSLSAINEAIIHAQSPEQMFQVVCDVASDRGTTLGACVFLHDSATGEFAHQASAGRLRGFMRGIKVSSDPGNEYGKGLLSKAFRTAAPIFVPDIDTDPREMPFRAMAARHGIAACAALPLMRGGAAVGMFFIFLDKDAGGIDEQASSMMQRIVDNVSFALEMFDRDAAKERFSRMFAALSATNAAILHAKTREHLFEMVCEAAVQGGPFASVSILMKREDTDILDLAAITGPGAEPMRLATYSISPDTPMGIGLGGTAFRSGQIQHSDDYQENPRFSAFHAAATAAGARSGAAVPLLCADLTVGVLLFMSHERKVFSTGMLELMAGLAKNITFALDNFAAAEERAKADERIKYLATHDEMTALPNRVMFSHMLNASIATSKRYQRQLAVLFIDLDRFKFINDTLGHEAGDKMLIEMGARITGRLRTNDVVARLGGDEFVVILNEVQGREGISQVSRNLLAAIAAPIDLSGHDCRVTASIGIAVYPEHGADEQALTKRADIAMYQAKEDGKNDFRFFSEDIKTQSIERLMLEASLRRAMERDEFEVFYQPKIDLPTNQITGVEALIRWNHPDLGMLSPVQFIPLAEETGLIVPIGRWVLREACRQNMEWQRLGLNPVTMAVNLSPRQFSDENLLNDIDEALSDSGMGPEMLQLEVTESMMMQHVERAIKMLTAIKSRGVRLAIDDFGTGYSSMSLLKRFPIDTLKIDRSFIKDLPEDREDMALTQAIIAMGKALNLTVIAEGVETAEQKAFLNNLACDEMQGYLFSKPLSNDDMVALFRKQPPSAPLQPDEAERRRIPERCLPAPLDAPAASRAGTQESAIA